MIDFLIQREDDDEPQAWLCITPFIVSGTFENSKRGFVQCDLELAVDQLVASHFVNSLQIDNLIATDQWGTIVWQGRIEDAAVTEAGIRLLARGDVANLADVYYRSQQVPTIEDVLLLSPYINGNFSLVENAVITPAPSDDVLASAALESVDYAVWEHAAAQTIENGLAFAVTGDTVEFGRNLTAQFTSGYATYTDSFGNPQRTTLITDPLRLARLGRRRELVVKANTTDSVAAVLQVMAVLEAPTTPSVQISIDRLFTADGAIVEGYLLRSGDRLTVRSTELEPLTIEAVKVDVITGSVEATVAVPTLEGFVVDALK